MKRMKYVLLVLCMPMSIAFSAPWATSVDFQSIYKLDDATVVNGEKFTSQSVEFPAVTEQPNKVVVLRFQARIDSGGIGGWNNYLGLSFNDILLQSMTRSGNQRVINKSNTVMVTEEGSGNKIMLWGSVFGSPESLLVFFSNSFEKMDNRVKSDTEELYWYMIDISDMVNYKKTGFDDMVIENNPNKLTFINRLVRDLVKGQEYNLLISNIEVGTIDVKDWEKKVSSSVKLTPFARIDAVQTIKDKDFTIEVSDSGVMQIVKDGETFLIDSQFSYPARGGIGYNVLSKDVSESQDVKWKPVVSKRNGKISIKSHCLSYSLERTVWTANGKICVSDKIVNTDANAVGVLISHNFRTEKPFNKLEMCGVPANSMINFGPSGNEALGANPTIFIDAEKANVGILAEDNNLRRNFGAVKQHATKVSLVNEHFGLDAGKTYTFEWSIYPFNKESDYWTFINRVRKDWGVNYTINGPGGFFDVQDNARLLKNPQALKSHLNHKKFGIVFLMPWLDYDNLNKVTAQLTTRAEYKEMMQEAAKAFREADPNILLVACMESFPYPLSLSDSAKIRDMLPVKKQGYPPITVDMLKKINVSQSILDDVFVLPDGTYRGDLYYRSGLRKSVDPNASNIPMASLVAYPVLGNNHHNNQMERAKFAIEEVGLDGIYVDLFNLSVGMGMSYSYNKWDGATVDIDPQTGLITRKYTAAGLVGATSRAELVKYTLKAGKVFVANTYPVSKETQNLHSFRFSESEYCFNPLSLNKGQEPPLFNRMCAGHLSTPIGLGYRVARINGQSKYAQVVMKTIITYLRHGALYYYYNELIPVEGPGAGENGPANSMYPITPVELGPGFVIGKERIISAKSHTFQWPCEQQPTVLVFDINGRQIDSKQDMLKNEKGWIVNLKIEDWENVAVIK